MSSLRIRCRRCNHATPRPLSLLRPAVLLASAPLPSWDSMRAANPCWIALLGACVRTSCSAALCFRRGRCAGYHHFYFSTEAQIDCPAWAASVGPLTRGLEYGCHPRPVDSNAASASLAHEG